MKFKKIAIFLLISFLLASCGPTDRQEASEDCLVFENQAACNYVDALKGVEETNSEIQEKEVAIEKLQEEIKNLKAEVKADKKSVEKLREKWEASKNPPATASPSQTGTPNKVPPTPTATPTIGGSN